MYNFRIKVIKSNFLLLNLFMILQLREITYYYSYTGDHLPTSTIIALATLGCALLYNIYLIYQVLKDYRREDISQIEKLRMFSCLVDDLQEGAVEESDLRRIYEQVLRKQKKNASNMDVPLESTHIPYLKLLESYWLK